MHPSFLWFHLVFLSFYQTSHSQECKGIPQFISALGFDPGRTALSTTERKTMGAVLIELENAKNTGSGRTKSYQDPSWRSGGYLGAIATDQEGNVFVIPKANVNMLSNPPKDQNTVYRIDSKTGKMNSFVKVPMTVLPHERNPYGLLGSFYDCDNHELIVSTVAGSDDKSERGAIYAIHTKTKKISLLLKNTDVIGLAIFKTNGQRKLLFALARKSEVWSLNLNAKNQVTGQAKFEFSIAGLGPRGDDRIRKMRVQPNGTIDMTGTSFFYNLSAPVDVPETIYNFSYFAQTDKWKLTGMR
ncbi:MAG: hypothetical protein IPM48_07310 [Saprospiraceae bacterium]|nr:hypothetical protein [Saprospiraceae bacterium]